MLCVLVLSASYTDQIQLADEVQELVKRYNPAHDMTTEERVRATARRVGLDSPIGYKPD